MNSLYKLMAMAIIMAITITCTRQQAEPLPEAEQTLFENIEPCCKLIDCDFNDPLVAKLYSDSMTIWHATAVLYNSGFFRINIKNNYIDLRRFPGWGNGNVALFACNIPEKLKKVTGKEVELDFRLLYFIPPPGADYSGYPVDLLRVKVLGNSK
jgi:hypothetical protein